LSDAFLMFMWLAFIIGVLLAFGSMITSNVALIKACMCRLNQMVVRNAVSKNFSAGFPGNMHR
ncbi:MAG: hypothetical protein V8R75_09150, partial [Oscillospiraceae bacterium]